MLQRAGRSPAGCRRAPRGGGSVEDAGASSDGIEPTRMAGVAARDAPRAHPRAAEEAVLLDRLLGVARARGLVTAARGHPAEGEPVGMDHRDAHPLQVPDLSQARPALTSPPCSARTPLRARSLPSAVPSA